VMANRKEIEPLVKVTLNLYERDYDALRVAYEVIGATVAIRRIVRAHVAKLNERIEAMNDG
jgi:glucan phosphorylase